MPYSLTNYHNWDVTPEEAVAIQLSLASRVSLTPDIGEVHYVAGVDNSATGVARCAVVILSYPELELVEISRAEKPLVFPYVPGLLSFREGPAILAAFDKILRAALRDRQAEVLLLRALTELGKCVTELERPLQAEAAVLSERGQTEGKEIERRFEEAELQTRFYSPAVHHAAATMAAAMPGTKPAE